MPPSPKPGQLVPFPAAARDRREHLLRIAAAAAPLLEAVVAARNATMAARIFEALGALSGNCDALARLDAIRVRDAEIVDLASRR